MLQQILREMYVDPEILAELDENQKQVLFCKMREEQVRRWRVWEAKLTSTEEENPSPAKNNVCEKRRKVDFLLGEDGEPWVWVMGEHPDDKTIEQILEEEAKEKARRLAAQHAVQLRLTVEAELDALLSDSKSANGEAKSEDIYCTVDEVKIRSADIPLCDNHNTVNKKQIINNHIINNNHITSRRDVLQEISQNKTDNVLARVAQWEKRVVEEKTSEIYQQIQKKQMEAVKEAQEDQIKQEQVWRQIQLKAKEAESTRREIARRAREEHRRSTLDLDQQPPALPPRTNPVGPSPPKTEVACPKPPSKDAILEWFKSCQFSRGAGLEPNGNTVAPWFHGLISRCDAERLLKDKPVGSFLVRVSERIWGYAISYKDKDRCKHYLIDASNGHYQFLGNNQISHTTLYDLINYHGAKPITALGGELLGRPCHRNEDLPAIFNGLIRAR